MIYATVEFYIDTYMSEVMDDEEIIERQLKNASRIIDILTFNRIKRYGFEKCSDWEKEIISEVCCEIADFYFENAEDLTTLLNRYTINGVTVEFGNTNANIVNLNGITIPRITYSKLSQTRFASLSNSYNYLY